MRNLAQFAVLALIIIGLMLFFRGGGGSVPHPAIFATEPLETVLAQSAADGKPVLVKFTASWCPPCKVMDREVFGRPSIAEQLSQRARVVAVDIDDRKDLAQQYKIQSIPTMVLFIGGEAKARAEGGMAGDELLAWMDRAAK